MHVQTQAQAPGKAVPAKVSCLAEKYSETVVNAKTGKTEQRANWVASCALKQGDDVIWQERLVLPYPATKHDAYDAIDEFMDTKAPQILKSKSKGETPK